MINIMTFIPFIFFGVMIVAIISSIKKGNIERSKMQAIKDGLESKKIITKEEMLNSTTSGNIFYVFFLLVFFLIVGGIVVSAASFENTSISLLIPYILFGVIFVLVPVSGIISNIKMKREIEMDNYYVEEDILSNKYSRRSDNNTSYYFEFQNQQRSIKTKSTEYRISEIGDKFYIIIVGKRRLVFNSNYYDLEDESKITKRI